LYTLYLQGLRDGVVVREHSVISCIRQSVNPYTDFEQYLRLAEVETLRFILSNTTEAGIVFEPGDRPDDRPPVSFPAKLTVFLYHRYQHFKGDPAKGLIIIPCELIDRNGEKLRDLVLRYASVWGLGEGFVSWLRTANVFCCSLVDRIVPGYPGDTIEDYRRELGYEDSLLVVGEPYHLWVIEGPEWIKNELPTARADLNVVYTEDLTPYRTRKVRILNGAHTALTPVAYLLGLETVGAAVGDAVAGRFLREAINEEIIPTLDMPRPELETYAVSVQRRHRSRRLRHQSRRFDLSGQSSSRRSPA
jgi:tagaturonate reductase